jgi:hypothetical protein
VATQALEKIDAYIQGVALKHGADDLRILLSVRCMRDEEPQPISIGRKMIQIGEAHLLEEATVIAAMCRPDEVLPSRGRWCALLYLSCSRLR